MRSRISNRVAGIFAAMASLAVLLIWGIGAARASAEADDTKPGGIFTMYAIDPLSQSLCFRDAREGHVFQFGQLKNRCSDIEFGNYRAGGFTVAIEGARLGNIVDLGSVSDLSHRYGYDETAGGGLGFASLSFRDSQVFILKDSKTQTLQALRESTPLLQEGKTAASAPVVLGHIYLVRLSDHYDQGFQRMVKLMVVAYTPEQFVTIRWQLM